MLYEVMKYAFISFLPHPVNNTPMIGNMWRNQRGEPVFKSIQNGRINVWLKCLTALKFKQLIDMGNQEQNVIGCKGCSKYSDHIVVQDPRSARSHDNLLKLDPGSPGSSKIFSVDNYLRSLGSHGNVAVTESKIFRIP